MDYTQQADQPSARNTPATHHLEPTTRLGTRQRTCDIPQFSLRLLLLMLATCATSFAMCVGQYHVHLTIAASMVIVFWLGAALAFVGLVFDAEGDGWLVPAVLAETTGTTVAVIAIFTGTYYGSLFFVVEFPRLIVTASMS